MGNVQCLSTETVYDRDYNLQVDRKSTSQQGLDHLHAEDDFLRPHPSEKSHRCLLEPSEVSKALVEQAEELLMRDDDGPLLMEDAATRPPDFRQQEEEEEALQARMEGRSQAGAPSTVTTMSAATQQAHNVRAPPRIARKPFPVEAPPVLKGKDDFVSAAYLHRDIKAILKQAQHETRQHLRLHPLHATCRHAAAMSSTTNGSYARRVKAHTAVLHLKMFPRCVRFYNKQLSRLLPDNAVTRAVSHSIVKTKLSPPRRRFNMPVLVRSDSSMSDGDAFVGEGPPSAPIMLLATDTSFMDLAITGSLGMVDRRKQRSDRGHHNPKLKSPDHYIVLMNRRSGIPLAVCALKGTNSGPPVVRIFATKRRVYGQKAAATTQQLGLDWSEDSQRLPLYTWAEIVTQGRYPAQVRYSIYMATGADGKFEETPSYCAVHETSGSPELRIVGRTEKENHHAGCAVLSMCKNDDCFADDEDAFFRLSVSRGVDPALLICFAAFVDESLEKTMRLQCQHLTQAVYQQRHC